MHQRASMSIILMIFLLMRHNLTFGQFTEFSADYKDNNVIDYTFRYYVDDADFGVSMDHWEEKRDDRIVGRYALLEPGGYIRSVYYIVDGTSGFRSSVQTRMLGGVSSLGAGHQITLNKGRSQPLQPYQHLLPIEVI